MTTRRAGGKAKKPAKATAYVVQRRYWTDQGAWVNGWVDGAPERVFADRTAARRYAAERGRRLRAFTNPFTSGDPKDLCRGGQKKFLALLKKLGVAPPEDAGYYGDWARWWDRIYPDLSDAQRDALWDGLDNLELYKVVKVTLEG